MGGRPIGRTPDSGSGYPGSSPGLPANLFNGLARVLPQTWKHQGTLFQALAIFGMVFPGASSPKLTPSDRAHSYSSRVDDRGPNLHRCRRAVGPRVIRDKCQRSSPGLPRFPGIAGVKTSARTRILIDGPHTV